MREDGWLEKEFQAARKRVSEWPQWKKEIQAKNCSSEIREPESTPLAKAATASGKKD